MGRPNLTEKRTAEILDAFERCVARLGLEGSTLERVADEAGMKRSILRHYVGNRDELVQALAERVVAKYRNGLKEFLASDLGEDRVASLLDFFLPDEPVGSTESVMVVEALIAAGEQYPAVNDLMLGYVDALVGDVARELRTAYPKATASRCWGVAYGVVCVVFNQESLSPLGLPAKYLKAARSSARLLVGSLAE